jgi:hypothetical protein
MRSLSFSLLAAALAAAPVREALGQSAIGELCAAFSAYDQNEDGVLEIEALRPLASAGAGGPRVLVLVEERLLGALEGAPALGDALRRHSQDLAAEGWRAELVAVRLASSAGHRDGRLLLALREFLRGAAPLDGVVLVGRFPDAFLVRTCNWRKSGELELFKGTDHPGKYSKTPYLRRVPEDVAWRADIVLADLDGRWEERYVEASTDLPTVWAAFPDGVPSEGGFNEALEQGTLRYEDFFHIDDGAWEVTERLDAEGRFVGHDLALADREADHECGELDRALPNALAQPDISVSRIDARGVALRPARKVRDAQGLGLLDDAGLPQTLTFAGAAQVPHWRDGIWEEDPVLERRLLLEFFERNHAYRSGAAVVGWRPSSIACDLGSGLQVMRAASPDWASFAAPEADVHGRPQLAALVDWLRYPAVLRTLRAHSDSQSSYFAPGGFEALAEKLGGPAWSWTPRGAQLVPSLEAACAGGKLDWFLLRSLWENGGVAREPSLYLHTGCHGISPPGAQTHAYDDPRYAQRQGAEALLFFASGLALVGRAKVFYDEPRGFAEALGTGGTVGDAWARYFELESGAESWSEVGGDIGRKRAYFWSVLGDWTLRLQHNGA